MRRQKNEGITLIALVITIIVLLILAGVSIATVTGENGILNQANNAKEETSVAETEEQRKLKEQEVYMEKYNFVDTEITEEEATNAKWSYSNNVINSYTGSESTIYIPSKIGEYEITQMQTLTFAGNTAVTKVVSSVQQLNGGNFHNCTNLETVILKEGTKYIGYGTFIGCEKLEYIVLPSTLETIDGNNFEGSGIKNIVIPANVKTMGASIFKNCKNPITIHCEVELNEGETVPTGDGYNWSTDWLKDAPEGTTVDWGYKNK